MARILFACAGTLAQQSKISMLLQSIILCPQGSGKPAGDRISISGSPRAQATYYLAGGCTVAVGNKLCLPIGKSLFGLGPGSVPGATNAPSTRTNAPYHRDRFAVCHLATGRKSPAQAQPSTRYFLYISYIVVQSKKRPKPSNVQIPWNLWLLHVHRVKSWCHGAGSRLLNLPRPSERMPTKCPDCC